MTTYEIYNFCENLYHKDSDYQMRLWNKIEEWYNKNYTLYTLEQTLNSFDEENGLEWFEIVINQEDYMETHKEFINICEMVITKEMTIITKYLYSIVLRQLKSKMSKRGRRKVIKKVIKKRYNCPKCGTYDRDLKDYDGLCLECYGGYDYYLYSNGDAYW